MKRNGLYEQVKKRHLEVISSVAIFGFYGYDPIYSNPFYSTWNLLNLWKWHQVNHVVRIYHMDKFENNLLLKISFIKNN